MSSMNVDYQPVEVQRGYRYTGSYNVNQDPYTTVADTPIYYVKLPPQRCPYCGMARENCGCGYCG